jgi:23S rRNA pseudouridine955/2504/2580 synthase
MVTIDDRHAGQRLDNYLLGLLKGVPKSWVYRVLRRGEVRVNKGRSKPDRRLQVGDVVRVPPLRTAEREAGHPPRGLVRELQAATIYEDDRLLVINKPSGVAVHGGSGLSHGVIEALRAAYPQGSFLELVHRLDRETSGCLMLAKRRSELRRLQALQRDGRITKHYRALVLGGHKGDRWRVDLPLKKNTLRSGERIVRVDPEGKPAATRFTVLRRFGDLTLVDAELETGRTHQIRVHVAGSIGPILGDDKYGNEAAAARCRDLGLRRLFLHAATLSLDGPDNGRRITLEAPLPEALQSVLERLQDLP